jgi:hypothetical protein
VPLCLSRIFRSYKLRGGGAHLVDYLRAWIFKIEAEGLTFFVLELCAAPKSASVEILHVHLLAG